jgi:hypothetical protein
MLPECYEVQAPFEAAQLANIFRPLLQDRSRRRRLHHSACNSLLDAHLEFATRTGRWWYLEW